MPVELMGSSSEQRDFSTMAHDRWHCEDCGETHEAQFDACWKCGAERSGPRPAPTAQPTGDATDHDCQSPSAKMRFRLRFGLRTLFLAIAVLGTCLGLAGRKLHSYHYQKRIGASLARDGADVEYRFGNVIGISYLHPSVLGQTAPIRRDDIQQINRLRHLEWLDFSFTDLSDDLLLELHGSDTLEWLRVDCTKVTSEGIEELIGFPNLQIISVLVTQLDNDTEDKLRERFPDIYIDKVRLIDGVRVGDGHQ